MDSVEFVFEIVQYLILRGCVQVQVRVYIYFESVNSRLCLLYIVYSLLVAQMKLFVLHYKLSSFFLHYRELLCEKICCILLSLVSTDSYHFEDFLAQFKEPLVMIACEKLDVV